MEKNCKSCKNFFTCGLSKFLPFPENGCSDFAFAACRRGAAILDVVNDN